MSRSLITRQKKFVENGKQTEAGQEKIFDAALGNTPELPAPRRYQRVGDITRPELSVPSKTAE